MITKEDIKAELEGCSEPEKKLHEIAGREGLPVIVIRKMLRDLVRVDPPKEDESVHLAHYNVGHRITDPAIEKYTHRWTESELRLMSEYWNRHATVREIAEIMGFPETTIGGVVYSHRDLFPKRKVENPVWTEERMK